MAILNGFGGNTGFGELVLDRNDDSFSNQLNLPFAVNFYGNTFETFFVNNNGNITFQQGLGTFTPEQFPIAQQPLIAPYWADVDTRNEASGVVYLASPNEDTVVVTWDSVGYFSSNADLLNTFQLVLRDRSQDTGNVGDFDIEFRYDTLQWTTGDASGGTGGFGGTPAQAGFDAGNLEDFFVLPGSFTQDILNLQNTSNVNENSPGFWSFAIRSGTTPGETPNNPLLPIITEEGFNFDFNIQDPTRQFWIDPEVAIGYDYIVNSGPNISTVQVSVDATGSDGVYDIFFPEANNTFVDSGFDIGVNQLFSFVDNGFSDGVSRFAIRGIDENAQLNPDDPLAFVTGLQFVSSGTVDLNQNPVTIDTGGDSLLNTPIYRFQNTNRPGTYLFVGLEERNNILANFPEFQEEGLAFSAAAQPAEGLIALNRFQNSQIPGTYLYAGEQESVGIRQNFPNFIEEGVAFYVYGTGANQATSFNRFQNSAVPGTYLYAGDQESIGIRQNFPNFIEEGIAFEASA